MSILVFCVIQIAAVWLMSWAYGLGKKNGVIEYEQARWIVVKLNGEIYQQKTFMQWRLMRTLAGKNGPADLVIELEGVGPIRINDDLYE